MVSRSMRLAVRTLMPVFLGGRDFLRMVFALVHVETNLLVGNAGSRHELTAFLFKLRSAVRRELARKGVTLDLLWNEYKAEHPDGYAYTWFCTRYGEWANALPLTLRQTHAPGEKLFVDYSGDKVAIINAQTGEIREAELFVAVLGASNYTYAEATWTQQSSDWIGSHIRTFEFMGGCPEIVTPDNLKSGVHKPSFYDPIINRTYGEMASHYSVAVIPARSKKPRDKEWVSYCSLSCALSIDKFRGSRAVAPAFAFHENDIADWFEEAVVM